MSLRLFTISQDYRSHARAAQAYIDIFASLPHALVTLVEDPDEANVSYLHMEPNKATQLLDDIPSLNKTYKIGYCVWEADSLPKAHLRSIKRLDEIWTASWHNWLLYSKVHPRVRWIPHVTGGVAPAEASDIDAMRQMLALDKDDCVFLHIGEDLPRKNILGLTQSFHHVQQREPCARLIVKTDGESSHVRIETSGRIIYCRGDFSQAQIAALYALCHVYVSPHFGEGWGLTLSDAMQHKRLCVATGYSGNMEFMTAANSLLIDYDIDTIAYAWRYYLFTQDMSWAHPSSESIQDRMLEAMRLVRSGQAAEKIERAYRDIQTFDARHIRCLVRRRLQRISHLLTCDAAQ